MQESEVQTFNKIKDIQKLEIPKTNPQLYNFLKNSLQIKENQSIFKNLVYFGELEYLYYNSFKNNVYEKKGDISLIAIYDEQNNFEFCIWILTQKFKEEIKSTLYLTIYPQKNKQKYMKQVSILINLLQQAILDFVKVDIFSIDYLELKKKQNVYNQEELFFQIQSQPLGIQYSYYYQRGIEVYFKYNQELKTLQKTIKIQNFNEKNFAKLTANYFFLYELYKKIQNEEVQVVFQQQNFIIKNFRQLTQLLSVKNINMENHQNSKYNKNKYPLVDLNQLLKKNFSMQEILQFCLQFDKQKLFLWNNFTFGRKSTLNIQKKQIQLDLLYKLETTEEEKNYEEQLQKMEVINYQQMKTDITNDERFLSNDQNQKFKTQYEQQRSELNFKTEELTLPYLQQIEHLIKFYNEINNTTENDIQFLNITQTTNNKNKQINYPDLQFFLQLPKLLPQLKEISFETKYTLTELIQNNPNQYIQFKNNTNLLQNYLNLKQTYIQTQQTFKKTTLPQTYRKEILNEIALDYLNPAKLKHQLTNSQPQCQPQCQPQFQPQPLNPQAFISQQIYHLVKDYKLNPENTKYSQNKKLDHQINNNLIPSSEIESAENLSEGHIEQILTGLDLDTTVREVSQQIYFIFQGQFYKQKEEELESEISDEEVFKFKPKKGEFIEYIIPNYEYQKIYNDKKYLKFDKDVILRNCAGFNTDSRGANNCGIILDFHQEINLGNLINYQDLILGIFKLKSHKCENWYELFINNYRVTNNKYYYIIDLVFDHGS